MSDGDHLPEGRVGPVERKQHLIIVGAGGLGREIYHAAMAASVTPGGLDIGGFLDDRPDALRGSQLAGIPILGSLAIDLSEQSQAWLLMALGDPVRRQAVARDLQSRGGRFTTLVTPTARVTTLASRIADGCFFDHYALIASDVSIGRHTYVGCHAAIGHDTIVGDCCHLGAFSFIGGNARIGDRVTIRSHVTVCPGAVVEEGATIGPNSVVLRRVRAGETVMGVPAVRVVA